LGGLKRADRRGKKIVFVRSRKDGGASGLAVSNQRFVARQAVEKSEGCRCSLCGEAGYFRVPAVRAEGWVSLAGVGGVCKGNPMHSLFQSAAQALSYGRCGLGLAGREGNSRSVVIGLAVRGRRTNRLPYAKTNMPPPNPSFQRTAFGSR